MNKIKPRPGDYYETFEEALRIDPKTNLSWYEKYILDFKNWKSDSKDRKKYKPENLNDFKNKRKNIYE